MKNNLITEAEFADIVSLNPVAEYLAFLPSATLQGFDKVTGLCKERTCQHYEAALFLEDGGYSVIDDVKYDIHKGDLRFLRPGQKIYSKKMGDFYSLHFSFGNDEKSNLIATEFTKDFPVFMPSNNLKGYSSLFKELIAAKMGDTVKSAFLFKIKTIEFVCHLHETMVKFSSTSELSGKSRNVIDTVLDYFEKNYANDIGLEEISKCVKLHPVYFNRLFSTAMGIPPIAYLKRLRLNKSKELLLGTNLKVISIAERCGFSSSSYFIVQFKKEFGCTPAEFRSRNSELYFDYI